MKKPLPKLLSLFLSFLKIGAFTFGGGYAMISFLESEFVTRKQWLGKDEFVDMLGIAESTPGPIAVNTATYIGYKVAGILGALLATLAVCLPAFVIIFVISLFFDKFLELTYVGYAFRGIQVGVVYLIGSAGVKVFKDMEKNVFSVILAVVVFGCFVALSLFAVKFSTVFCILIGGMLGLALYFIRKLKKKEASATDLSAGTSDAPSSAKTPENSSAPSDEGKGGDA